MIRRVSGADATYGAGTQMVGVGRRNIVLKRLMMGYVVAFVHAGYRGGGIAVTTSRTVAIDDTQVESALEPTPGNSCAVKQGTDVRPTQLNLGACRGRTHVTDRVSITNQRQTAVTI